MEFWFVALGVAVAVTFIWTPIYALVLARRIKDLKARLAQLEARRWAETGPLPDAPAEPAPEPALPLTTPWQRLDVPLATPKPVPVSDDQNQPLVIRPDRFAQAAAWLLQNWVYVVSALSLSLAAVFLAIWGVEQGLLPPVARVAATLALGAALVGGGEWIRRRYGDGSSRATAYLPSTFSGAGIFALFAGVLAADQLYGLIGPQTAFAGLIAVAGLALVLGWLYGPWLAAVGLVGAAAAPFLVGGNTDATWWLYIYFTVIAGTGLAIDAGRRWAWVSVLALALGIGGGALVFAGSGDPGWLGAEMLALALLAIGVPMLKLMPTHGGVMTIDRLLDTVREWPGFPVRLAAGTVTLASIGLVFLPTDTAAEGLLAFALLAALLLALALWAKDAPALADLTALPALGFLARLGMESFGWPLQYDFVMRTIVLRAPESAAPVTVTVLMALALAGTLAAAWRSFRGQDAATGLFWAAGATLFAPLAALALELGWAPTRTIGPALWATHVIALAALMVWLAVLYARADGESRRRAALATLSALSLIAFALFIMLTETALTVALGALVVVAAALDRRFRLPEMGLFIQAAMLVLGYRLFADPGIGWALDAPVWEVILAFGSASAALPAAQLLLKDTERARLGVILESGALSFGAVLADVLIFRWLRDSLAGDAFNTHWGTTLMALPWLMVAFATAWRLQLGGPLTNLRRGFATVTGAVGLAMLAAAAVAVNPTGYQFGHENDVVGPMLLDTLTLAYLLPAALFFAAARLLRHLGPLASIAFYVLSGALAVLWVGLEIRHFWVGSDLSVRGISQGEQYSYTVAMMLGAAATLWQSIALGSSGLRRLAMAGILLTVAKVFLIDASGLSGLTRVASFLGLGLALAAAAWLNRWAAERQRDATDGPDPAP